MPARSHVGWGLCLSLLLHATGLVALTLALPRVNVRPGAPSPIDFAVLSAPTPRPPDAPNATTTLAAKPARPDEPSAPAVAVELTDDPTASVALSPAPSPAPAKVAAPKPAHKARARPVTQAPPGPKPSAAPPTAATPSTLPSAARADPHSDGSALERVLRQIAATSELTPDERRRAMLIVLRTWEDPSGRQRAEQLVDALIENARATTPPR